MEAIFVAVSALPLILPTIVLENVLVPAIVSFPVFITAPADATLAESVTSAFVSMLSSLFFKVVVKFL